MHPNEKICTYLTINGFTINPIKDSFLLKVFIDSLCKDYKNNHMCDHGLDVVHQGYLGDQIGEPSIKYIQNENFQGLVRFCNFR